MVRIHRIESGEIFFRNNQNVSPFPFLFYLFSKKSCNHVLRGSKQDMQAAAAGTQNAEYVGDEQAILESEQQYP